jgi:hypothetical protein
VNDRAIAERITTLLSHYWTADEPPELRSLQIGDWLDDLAEFPAMIVAEACREWRQTERRRPLPVDIRVLCIAAQQRHREATAPKALPPPDIGDRRKAWERDDRERMALRYREAAEHRERWAREMGCANFGEALQIGLAVVARRKPVAASDNGTPVAREIDPPLPTSSDLDDPAVRDWLSAMEENYVGPE